MTWRLAAVESRCDWSEALVQMDEDPERTRELRQILVDAMDAVEQSDDEGRLVAALAAFDRWTVDADAPGGEDVKRG